MCFDFLHRNKYDNFVSNPILSKQKIFPKFTDLHKFLGKPKKFYNFRNCFFVYRSNNQNSKSKAREIGRFDLGSARGFGLL